MEACPQLPLLSSLTADISARVSFRDAIRLWPREQTQDTRVITHFDDHVDLDIDDVVV